MKIITLEQIKKRLPSVDLQLSIEEGFVLYSQRKAVIPPVGEMIFTNPPGDVHIKYGYLLQDQFYVVKIASGFYENPELGLSSSNGLMLIFSQKTGELVAILLDEGYLTDIRTAIAGAIAAKYLAPKNIHCVGIVGTGQQARLQLEYLKKVIDCRNAIVWGRDIEKLNAYKKNMATSSFSITLTQNMDELTSKCNLIVTTTSSKNPLIFAEQIRKGTHITAVGSDTPCKQELDSQILAKADLIVADSLSQCCQRGEILHALSKNLIKPTKIIELGNVIANNIGRTFENQISIADLTGVAIQDIQIAKSIYKAMES